MIATFIRKVLSFRPAQRVSVLGGEGTIQSYKREAETWMYPIKMALGQEPNFGRVSAETTVLLNEADLCAA
jgi:hypothetical protein